MFGSGEGEVAFLYGDEGVVGGGGEEASLLDFGELASDVARINGDVKFVYCLLYTSPSPRDRG